ncbi:DUF2264 domain-containing protein [Kluyvera cryocrescens]|uniref:DUF2264 domain-containing protein n=1 Tax=Kluyvera cryocrescens TaxID=580 RepID=UPI00224B19F7|nr:DUF2264 domain-containing protein [Kluyvera cryocrescens]MCX2866888.1 DUF2264 domain-containing protein [Kluyvera cryocrescens]WNN72430.1 DUF2264 domain-containing protein [Kluyvera cryocrescens]
MEISKILSSREEVTQALMTMLSALDKQFPAGVAQFSLGKTCAHYSTGIAEMEGLSRALWGLFPLMAGGADVPFSEKYINAIKLGTDPQSPSYWGESGPYDQRLVEMAAYGLGLALLQDTLTDRFSETELKNLHRWLNQITDAQMPDSNWNYFAIIVQLGFKRAGMPYDQAAIDRRFNMMEAYYLGGGWYSDGPGRPKDYYISMAFHFYGLIYATLNAQDDPVRAATLRERAGLFAKDFIYLSAADGASVPFGRSLTYRFAMVAFWSGVAFAGLDVFSPGVVKGLILRHLRWWLEQPIFDRDGILTLGFAYPNLAMCEDYNSPGSPYWALKVFLIMALPADSDFWQAQELPLPELAPVHAIVPAQQILQHHENSQHVVMLTSGQLELNNYVNTEAKYTKFAYSTRFGFTIERGRYGIKHAACDSMLLLSDNDNYWRGRRECDSVEMQDGAIYSRWLPWHDVQIDTWLIPCGDWHVRVHHVTSARRLQTVEGGFAVIKADAETGGQWSRVRAVNGMSVIADIAPQAPFRRGDSVVTPPNSSVMFAECAVIPTLTGEIDAGEHWLCCAVNASGDSDARQPILPTLRIQNNTLEVTDNACGKTLSLHI